MTTPIDLVQTLPRYDVRCYAGRPLTITVPVLDADDDPVLPEGMVSARAQIRATIGSEQVLHTFGTADDPADLAITVDGLVLTATSETTSSWSQLWPGRAPETVAWWDVEVTLIDGAPWQITEAGRFVVVHQVTR